MCTGENSESRSYTQSSACLHSSTISVSTTNHDNQLICVACFLFVCLPVYVNVSMWPLFACLRCTAEQRRAVRDHGAVSFGISRSGRAERVGRCGTHHHPRGNHVQNPQGPTGLECSYNDFFVAVRGKSKGINSAGVWVGGGRGAHAVRSASILCRSLS